MIPSIKYFVILMRVLFAIVLCSTIVATAHAEDKKYGEIKFGGVIYSFLYANLSHTQPVQNSFPQEKAEPLAAGYSQFDVERVYLNVSSELSDNTKFRITTDIFRNAAYPGTAGSSIIVKDTSGKTVAIPGSAAPSSYYNGLSVRLKYAYFDWSPASDVTLRMGMQQTPWFDGVEKVWKYRGVQMTAGDKNGFLSSADLGLSATYLLPEKFGTVSAYVLNGNGYGNPEFNRFKDVALRAEIVPMASDETLKGLKITGMYYKGANSVSSTDYSSGALKNDILGAMLSYQGDQFSIGAEYLGNAKAVSASGHVVDSLAYTQNVISMFGELKAPGSMKEELSLFARLDLFTPTNLDISAVTDATASASNTKNTFMVAGLAYKASKSVTLTADYQGTTFGNKLAPLYGAAIDPNTSKAEKSTSDSRFFIHGIVSF
jgi:hypothetical protein